MTISIDPQKTNNESLQPKGWLRYFSFSLDHKVIGDTVLSLRFSFLFDRRNLSKRYKN